MKTYAFVRHIAYAFTMPCRTYFVKHFEDICLCSIGVFLRKLESGLRGISHVVIDEIHERDINVSSMLSGISLSTSRGPLVYQLRYVMYRLLYEGQGDISFIA